MYIRMCLEHVHISLENAINKPKRLESLPIINDRKIQNNYNTLNRI